MDNTTDSKIINSNKTLIEKIAELDERILLADGFDEAVIGVTYRDTELVALYSADKILQILVNEHDMPYDEAVEYFEYNIEGAYMGTKTPVYYSLDLSGEEIDP